MNLNTRIARMCSEGKTGPLYRESRKTFEWFLLWLAADIPKDHRGDPAGYNLVIWDVTARDLELCLEDSNSIRSRMALMVPAQRIRVLTRY